MNKYIISFTLCIAPMTGMVDAYTPDLYLLGDLEKGKSYLDIKSIKKMKDGYIQVTLYDKHQSLVWSHDVQYLSSIKTYVLNCKDNEIANKSGSFYEGKTSNSKHLIGYNFINSRNGDTGVTTTSIDNLEFLSLSDSDSFFYHGITPYYKKVFAYVCY